MPEGLPPSDLDDPSIPLPAHPPSITERVLRRLIGNPRDLTDRSLFHRLSLVPLLAWIGLGADGLSSSCYGPEEAFKTLAAHTYLALALAVVMGATVFVIALAYRRVIEHFPYGGGGYVVATKLLGRRAGVVSGCALLVDYVLTITVSIAAAGDALFSLLPVAGHTWKLPLEIAIIASLIILNFRGVRESVLVLSPIFLLFVITHVVLIGGGLVVHAPHLPKVLHAAGTDFSGGMTTLGIGGMLLLFLHAYSLGGGTYTGIEAVSNGLTIMREPRVQTGKRTMLYMACSLAFTAAGLLLCYLLWDVRAVEGRTMNAVLAGKFVEVVPLSTVFVFLTLIAEGALLAVAAQAGFVDGPRVLANMAIDSWVPRRFAALSDRLTTQNGILLMGLTALAALWYTHGNVRQLVVMYSINVFITFSMTMASMCRYFVTNRGRMKDWKRRIPIHAIGLVMCLTILVVTVYEKFSEGGWITLLVTGACVGLCFVINRHYRAVAVHMACLDRELRVRNDAVDSPAADDAVLDPTQPTAVVLVGSYSGMGVHTLLHVVRAFPRHFRNFVFISVGVIDSGTFKGHEEIDALTANTRAALRRYVGFCRGQGLAAAGRLAIGTEIVSEAEKLCLGLRTEFPNCVFFAGQLVFQAERWYQRLLHNQTAFALQTRLQEHDVPLVIMPVHAQRPARSADPA